MNLETMLRSLNVLKKFKIVEHPIIFINRVLGNSKMNGNIIWEALFGVLLLRITKSKYK